jgi:hypothetical protein
MESNVLIRRVALLLCLMALCVSVPGAVAAADGPKTVRVGVYENPPKISTDDQGLPIGFWPDIIEYIAQQEGWEIDYVPGTWSEGLQRLTDHKIDIMPDVAYTADRGRLYEFAHEVVYTSWATVYATEGSGIQSVLDLNGKTVAVLKGSVNVEGPGGIKELVTAFNVDCVFIETDSYAAVFALVSTGGADAGVTSKDHGYQYKADFNLEETPIIFQPSLLYFAFPKGASLTPLLIDVTDTHIKDLKESGDSVYYQSLRRWFAQEQAAEPMIPTWLLVALAGVAGMALLFAAGSFVLRSQVRSRTRELTQEISRRKEAEQELAGSYGHLEELVRQRTTELEQANRHKSQFLANMSHELRTPLNSILGYTKLMLDGMEGDVTVDQKEDLQTVYDNSKHLLSLINDLLDLSKIEAGKFEIIKEEFPLSDLLSQIVPSMQKLAGDKGLELTSSVAAGVSQVYADRNKTKQILFNLLGNAVKFTEKGSVTLSIDKSDGDFLFSVTDTGRGIPQQDIGHLFQSYKQVGPARLDGSEGTGLGLVISKQFVELQGGRIWVESTPGSGSTFAFTLPEKDKDR